jgi:hypothetical protein
MSQEQTPAQHLQQLRTEFLVAEDRLERFIEREFVVGARVIVPNSYPQRGPGVIVEVDGGLFETTYAIQFDSAPHVGPRRFTAGKIDLYEGDSSGERTTDG